MCRMATTIEIKQKYSHVRTRKWDPTQFSSATLLNGQRDGAIYALIKTFKGSSLENKIPGEQLRLVSLQRVFLLLTD